MEEFKDLLDELKTATSALTEADEKRREEIKKFGDATAETKETVDRIQSQLDEVELKFERLSLEAKTDKDGKSAEVKAFEAWAKSPEAAKGTEPGMLVFSEEDAAAVLAPAELITELLEKAYNVDPILGLVRTRRISRGSVMYPTKESRAVAVRDGAAPDFTLRTGKAEFGKNEIAVYGAHAIADIDAVSLEDPSIDLAADLMGDWAYSFGQMEAPEILTGDPRVGCGGILRPTTPTFLGPDRVYTGSTAQAPAITYESLVDLVAELNDAYDANARFVLNRKTLHALRLIEDSEGHLIWQPTMAQGNPGTILGYPYSKSPNMVDVADGATPILFGDFNAAYWLVQRIDVQVQRDPYTQWPHVRFKARKRSGGDLVMAEALKALVVGAKPAG